MAQGPTPDITCGPCRPWGQSHPKRPEEKERGGFILWPTLEPESEGLASEGFASPAWQAREARAVQTQEIINPTQALPSQQARLALVIKRSYPLEHPCPSRRTPPSSSQPSAPTSISCDNLQTEDQLASPPTPHAQASARPPPCPTPHGAPAAGGPGRV